MYMRVIPTHLKSEFLLYSLKPNLINLKLAFNGSNIKHILFYIYRLYVLASKFVLQLKYTCTF